MDESSGEAPPHAGGVEYATSAPNLPNAVIEIGRNGCDARRISGEVQCDGDVASTGARQGEQVAVLGPPDEKASVKRRIGEAVAGIGNGNEPGVKLRVRAKGKSKRP